MTCAVCHFPVELDDCVFPFEGNARTICLLCYGCQTGTYRRMPKHLRRELIALLAALPVGSK